MASYAGYEGAVFVSSGAAATLTEAPTTADTARKRYQITDASKRYLTRVDAVTVESSPDGTTWTTLTEDTDYNLIRIGGIVEFATARPVGTAVRVSGKYLTLVELGNVQGWSLELSREIQDYVVMRQGYKRKQYTVGDSKGSIDRLWIDSELFEALSAMTEIVMVLYVNYDDNLAYGLYSQIGSLKIENSGDALVSESVDFEGNGTPYYIEPLS